MKIPVSDEKGQIRMDYPEDRYGGVMGVLGLGAIVAGLLSGISNKGYSLNPFSERAKPNLTLLGAGIVSVIAYFSADEKLWEPERVRILAHHIKRDTE